MFRKLWNFHHSSLLINSKRNLSINKGIGYVEVEWAKGSKSKFHNVWLRDNCACPQCLHPSTRQKLISSSDIPLDIKPISIDLQGETLNIVWNESLDSKTSEEHASSYPIDWLKANDYSNKETVNKRRHLTHERIVWDLKSLESVDLWISYEEFMDRADNDKHMWRFVDNLQKYGLGLIRGIPDKLTVVEDIAERFGPIRETFYGRSWDVKSTIDAKNIAYTSLFLDLHMDLMYFESPPGIQFLHVLQSSMKGGDSIFADTFKAVEILKKYHPQDYDILSNVPVTFHYNNNGHYMKFIRPTIIPDDPNHGLQVNYAPPFQAPLEASYEMTEKFYAAFKKFDKIIHDPSMVMQKKLEAGDCAVFQNRRVLHGRLAFDSSKGTRHLRGTYVDWDVMMDRFRTLKRSHS